MELDTNPWYAVRTRSRHEKAVHERLTRQGRDTLLPLYSRTSQWSDRRVVIEQPLFSGYVFARFSSGSCLEILQVPGVAYIVSVDHRPAPIPLEEIESLRMLMASGMKYEPSPLLPAGTQVRITRGPLFGMRGQLLRREGEYYIVVGIQLIQHGATVKINRADIEPAHEDRGPFDRFEAPRIVARSTDLCSK